MNLFITGTDTGVGKTLVTALLADCMRRRGIDAGVMKPVASGCGETERGLMSPDVLFFERVLGPLDPLELVNPVCYRAPLAPSIAARLEGRTLDLAALDRAFEAMSRRHKALLVEGVGGLLVPLEGRFTVADLALRWRLHLLVVARPGLGTINHTALTVLHARSRGIPAAGFLFNSCQPGEDPQMTRDNAVSIVELTGVPFLGSIPWGGKDPLAPDEWERLVVAAGGISDPLNATS